MSDMNPQAPSISAEDSSLSTSIPITTYYFERARRNIPLFQLAELREAATNHYFNLDPRYHGSHRLQLKFLHLFDKAVSSVTDHSNAELLSWPPKSILETSELHLLEFLQTLYPYFVFPAVKYYETPKFNFHPSELGSLLYNCAELFFEPILPIILPPPPEFGITGIPPSRVRSALKKRHRAGLLREGQVQLFNLALRQYSLAVREVKANCELDGPSTSTVGVIALRRASALEKRLRFFPQYFMNMVSGERFRSERLEILLLRYINDGEPANMEVVKGLEEAHDLLELARFCNINRNRHHLRKADSTDTATGSASVMMPNDSSMHECCFAKRRFFSRSRWNDLRGRYPAPPPPSPSHKEH